jgi:hypothetical protein
VDGLQPVGREPLAGARLQGARMDKGTRLEGAAGEPADTGAEGVVMGTE